MDRTERFYKIDLLIRNRGCVSFADLMAEVGVSRATLKRDLEYLRDRLDAPIVYDRFANGYKLQADGRAPQARRHELPGLWFSEPEIHALLTMHQLVQGLDEGGVLARHLQPLLDKLHGLLGAAGGDAAGELMKRVKIMSPARRPVAPRQFELVGGALMRRRRLRMGYYVRSRQQQTQRTVSPQRLVHYRNTWYLDAWCHASDGLRRFALDAMRDASVLDEPAHEVDLAAIEAELDAGYGVFSGAALEWATLHFAPEAAQWVRHEQWHPNQQAAVHDDGSLTLRVPYADATELAMDVLRHGEQVQVLAPPALASLVQRRLRAAIAAYADTDTAGRAASSLPPGKPRG